MQRFNGFTLIHKALRAMMYDAALTIQQTNFADVQEADSTFEKIESVIYNFGQHAHHEDHHILPAVQQFRADLVEAFEKEHAEDVQLSIILRNLLNIYRHLHFTEERVECGSAISKGFVDFMTFNLQHMAKEEQLLLPVLWENYSDAQLMAINQQIVANIPPQEMMVSATWMLRGINNQDAINWIKGLRKNAPEIVFKSLLSLAERELPAERFNAIMPIVMETEMVLN